MNRKFYSLSLFLTLSLFQLHAQWTDAPPDAIITPIPNTFSANMTFGNTSGEVCIFVNSLCGVYSDCLFVEVEQLCADAGEDEMVCGYQKILNGFPLPGSWEFLCDMSDGEVAFSSSFNPQVTVSNCGDYFFEYQSNNSNCMDTDTVMISFENPSSGTTDLELDMSLEYKEIECHEGGESEPCKNMITIPGAPPLGVEWEFCVSGECQSIVYSTEVYGGNGCMADSININTENYDDSFSTCNGYEQDDVLNNFWDIYDGLLGTTLGALNCPIGDQCYPPEGMDTIIHERTVWLPKREGGNWYILLPNDVIFAEQENFFSYNNHDFVLYVNPDGDYYGPENIDLELFEITPLGDTVYQSIQVDFQMQWIEEWSYVEVTDIDTFYVYNDPFLCGGMSVNLPSIDVPPIPDYPCDPIDVSFPPYDCELCPVDITINAEPDFGYVDCCSCETLFGTGSSSEGNVSIKWENGNSTMTVCQGGAYTMTVTSLPSGCSKQETVYVDENYSFPHIQILPPDEINCLNPCVLLETEVSGNSSQHSYSWTGPGGFSSNELSPIVCEPGTYQLIAFNFWSCCEDWAQVTVTEFNQPIVSDIQEVLCPGECYDLNGETYCGKGTYSQNGFDQNGCPTITNLDLDYYDVPSENIQMTICENESYIFQSTGNVYDIENPAGTEILQSTEGCDSLVMIEIDFYSATTEDIQMTICENDSYVFQPTGNIYDIGNPTGTEIIQSLNGCDSIVNIDLGFYVPQNEYLTVELCEGECYDNSGVSICDAGIHSFNIQDGNGCEAQLDVEINLLSKPSYNLELDLCENESIEINGTIYDQSNKTGTEIFQALNGCDSLVYIQINVLPTEYQFFDETVCEGECLELNGETFCTPGTYIQNIQGSNGCEATVELVLSNFIEQTTNLDLDLCQGDFIEVNGTIYDENNPMGTEILQDKNGCDSLIYVQINSIPTEYQYVNATICASDCYDLNGEIFCDEGVYFQSFTGTLGCEAFIQLNLSKYTTESSNLEFELCEGEFIEINGNIYDENNPTGTEIFQDLNGCDSLVYIQVNSIPTEYFISNAEICEGACIDFFGQQICDAGLYNYIQTGSNGCEEVHELNVEVLETFTSDISEPLCTGEQIIVNGTIYNQSNPIGQEILVAQNGCDSVVNISLDIVGLGVNILPPNTINCIENSVEIISQITANEAIASVNWTTANGNIISDPTSTQIEVDTEGNYFIEVTTVSGCTEMIFVNVEEDLEAPIPIVIESLQLDCHSNEAQLVCENDNLHYEWSGPGIDDTNRHNQNPTISISGNYELTLTNLNNGCSNKAQVQVAEAETIEFEVLASPSCPNEATGTIEILTVEGGQAPYVLFVNGTSLPNPDFGFMPGIHQVEVWDANGCITSKEIEITERPELEFFNQETIHICGVQEVILEPEINFPNEVLSYNWDDGTSIPSRIITREGTYTLTIQNECEAISHDFEVIDDEFSIRNKIYVPNAFSPNEDGVNDVFKAYVGTDLTEYELMVFDRWGNLVFESSDSEKGWNGGINSDKIDSAVFIWMLHAKGFGCDDQLQDVMLRGDVVLLR